MNSCYDYVRALSTLERKDARASSKAFLRLANVSSRIYSLESRIDGFAFQRQNAEDTLVNTSQRFALDKSLQAFYPQSKLSQS